MSRLDSTRSIRGRIPSSVETGKDLPDNIQAYWRELQGWDPQQEHVAVRGLGRERPWTLPATGKVTWRIVVLVFIAKIAQIE